MTTIQAKSATEKAFLSDIVRWYRCTVQTLTTNCCLEQVQLTSERLKATVVQELFVYFLKQSDVISKNSDLETSTSDLNLLQTVLEASGIAIDLTLQEFHSDLGSIFDRYSFSIDEMKNEYEVLTPIILSQISEALMAIHLTPGTLPRKRTGSFDTPPEIVNSMVSEALVAALKSFDCHSIDRSEQLQSLFSNAPQLHPFSQTEVKALVRAIASLKIIDPACGSGAFPLEVLHQLTTVLGKLDPDNQYISEVNSNFCQTERVTPHYYRKQYLLKHCIFGVDIQPIVIQITKMRCFLSLFTEIVDWGFKERSLIPSLNFIVTNALLLDSNQADFMGRFDIAIANPPYVDSEEMVKTQADLRKAYTSNFESAKGNWDLFVVFIERGIQLLKTNGILTYIVPNKLVAATYTKTLRTILNRYAILSLKDYSKVRLFQAANVYPIVLVLQKKESQSSVETVIMASPTQAQQRAIVPATLFYRDTDWDRYFVAKPVLQLMSKLALFPPLNTYCSSIVAAATVSEAYALKPFIQEKPIAPTTGFKKLINTGTIDRYSSRWGQQAIRYLGDRFTCPIVLDAELFAFSQHRFRQATAPKIIIGGMTQVLECFYDEGEYLAGKSTTIILEGSINFKYLLAILNSSLVSFWYKNFYRSLTLAGGYLRVSNHEIKNIPIPDATIEQQETIVQLVEQVLRVKQVNPTKDTTEIEQQINQVIFHLYGLTAEEVALINQ